MHPNTPMLYLVLLVLVAIACGAPAAVQKPGGDKSVEARVDRSTAGELFRDASQQAGTGDLLAVLETLTAALEAGYETPSDVLSSTSFRALRDDPVTRKTLRDLMARHVRSSAITMVDSAEPGTPLDLEIRIVDGVDSRPLEGVVVEIVHVDDRGLYQPSDLDQQIVDWNPRLFGFCVTNADGKVRVRTIRPVHYHSHYDAEEPAHVHFTVSAAGYRPWGGEIFFDDDERVDAGVRDESRRVGTPIAKPVTSADGVQRTAVELRLQRVE